MSGTDRDDVDHDLPEDDGRSSASGARFFPIGFGLGAVAALALFVGYRAVAPTPDGAVPAPVSLASGAIEPEPSVPAAGDPPAAESPASARPTAAEPALAVGADAPDDDAPAYAAAAADLAAATLDAPDLAGLEELASLGRTTPPAAAPDDAFGPETLATGARPPSIGDPETADLFGGPVMMVSSSVPRVIVLADGTSLVPGGTLPGGHRIVDIRRERVLLERDGVEWRVRIP